MSYLIPNVIETTPRGERITDIFTRLLSERIILVGTPIDDGVANAIVGQVLHLASESEADIQLYVNSPGGSFTSVMAIYDTCRFVPNDVATLCVGRASSAAGILVAGGTKGKRSMLPHSRIVLEQPASAASRGSLSDLALEAAEMARIRAETDRALAHHTGKSEEIIRADTDRALILGAAEAVTYGLADQVVTSAPQAAINQAGP